MPVLDQLEPKRVFGCFEELSRIPRGSGNTRAVSDFLARFAQERGLKYHQDGSDNVVIWKAASPGYESAAPVILQGHMDMVCEVEQGCDLDMRQEGPRLATDGETVWAEGSTLGADNGAAAAMLLALLDDDALPHPPLECVFTADEEIGMLGAAALDFSLLRGRRMLNLDSEAEGVFTASCAGGRVVTATLPLKREAQGGATLEVCISGLTGGHSGTEIHKGRQNADQLLGRLLESIRCATMLRVVAVAGGKKDNAIPALSRAVIRVGSEEAARRCCESVSADWSRVYAGSDPGLRVTLSEAETGTMPFDADGTRRLIALLTEAPNGVQAMSPDVPGLVQTSLNLGILETRASGIEAVFSLRSSVEREKVDLTEKLAALVKELGGTVKCSGDYPGWAFRRESPLRELLSAVYREQTGMEPVVDAIHAGLECGLFVGALPGLDCVSIGPDLEDIHTPRERMSVASVARTWALLTETLRRMTD